MSRFCPHPNQLYLPDLEPQAIDNLFFALRPDIPAGDATDKIAWDLRGVCGLKGKPLGSKLLHATLHGIGCFEGLPRDVVETACAVASTVAVGPFDIIFDRAVSFAMHDRKRPLVLLGDESEKAVMSFQKLLGDALARRKLRYTPPRQFTPHMTILYDYRSVDMRPIEPVRWKVREFVLIRSFIGQHEHACLGRWDLKQENPTVH